MTDFETFNFKVDKVTWVIGVYCVHHYYYEM